MAQPHRKAKVPLGAGRARITVCFDDPKDLVRLGEYAKTKRLKKGVVARNLLLDKLDEVAPSHAA